MIALRRVTGSHSADSEFVRQVVRVFRAARHERLQFLLDLHDADEDRRFVSAVMLADNAVWVAEANGALAGFIAFANEWVNQLYVDPAFQGQGVGRALLAVAQRDATSLQLWAFEVNEPAIRFYERHGFRIVERTDGDGNEPKRPDVLMEWRRDH